MAKDKPNINEELDHIKNIITKKNNKNKIRDDDNFILLDKIVSKSKKPNYEFSNKNEFKDKEVKKSPLIKNEITKTDKRLNNSKKSTSNKFLDNEKKPKDPVAALVEREIKPIIKKWISKNLKSFVKTIVMQEMKLISKATQKHK